jgi:hypothetical protein
VRKLEEEAFLDKAAPVEGEQTPVAQLHAW